ncbi:MAG: hypothetical protein HY675_21860 [Chloroflexi bacterium]|nr:hypothetical protein [Chloroflexota bacterium]
MDWFSAAGYDGLQNIVDALKAVGPDAAKMRDYLENTTVTGLNGMMRRGPNDHMGPGTESYAMTRIDVAKKKFVIAP